MNKAAHDLERIRRRARSVLATYAGGHLDPILNDLRSLGDVGVFGGLLRDVAFDIPGRFVSDVDVVVATGDEAAFDSYCRGHSATKNRFGGYRLTLPRGGRMDLWPLQRTWAFREGVRKGSSLVDLLGTTYFSWDSIVYNLNSGKIHCRPDYLRMITDGIVDIELPVNPYPLGALVRTLRLVVSSKANLSWKLARHTFELFQTHSVVDIVSAERHGYVMPWLKESSIVNVRRRLDSFLGTAPETAIFRSVEQMVLRLTPL